MKAISKCALIWAICLFIGCKENDVQDNDADLKFRYFNLESSGWRSRTHSETVDGLNFKGTEVPIQYYILKEMGPEHLKETDSIYEANKRDRIVEFTFEDKSKKDVLDPKFTGIDYQKGVEYISSGIQKDFYVVTTSKDTIPCSGVIFERNFKIAPYSRVLLFFSGIKPEDKIQLVYNDVLFKKGILKFKFADPILKL